MPKRAIAVLVLLTFAIALAAASLPNGNTVRPAYAPDLIKVKLSPDAMSRAALPQGLYAESASFGINELDQLMSVNGGTKVIRAHRRVKDRAWEARTGWDRWFLVKLDGRAALEQALASFRANRFVEEAIYEYYAYPSAVPNDPQYSTNWGHNNTAQFPSWNSTTYQFTGPAVGTVGFDTDAQLAWDQTQGYGSADIVIAIIDSGVDTTHPDLRLVAGYDYGVGDSNPMDDAPEAGHGTLCAGVTAAMANNNLGVAGIAGGCSVMPLKVADAAGSMSFTSIANAITHAADNDANVISMSLGANGISSDTTVDNAISYAITNNVVVFAATGNYYDPAYISGNQIQDEVSYPANNQNVISVGAASPGAERKSYTSVDNVVYWGSCYGTATQDDRMSVDIMAPSLLPSTDIQGTAGWNTSSGTAGNYYVYFGGTSCATPYAAGVAALLLSFDPSLTPAEIRSAMVSTTTDMTIDGGAGWDRYTGYGMVNANAALMSLAPGLPTCQITAPTGGSVHDLNSSIQIDVSATDSDGTITDVKIYVDDVLKYTDSSSPYGWLWNTTGYSGGSHTIKAIATDNDLNTRESTVTITLLAPPDEGFETGNFSAFGWNNTSAVPWTVQSSQKYSGTYAAQAAGISNSASTTLSITLNVTTAGDISYFYKVSSEANYDYLRFYIDDVQQAQWSGEAGWALQTHSVTTGLHNFKWTYSKDGSSIYGSDTAWLDHIIFPEFGAYYPPPRNLAAVGGDGFVNLSWQAPDGGTPNTYRIFKNGSELTTTTNLYYTDNAVTNGNTYSYYLTAVYSGGESEPTATVNATPNVVSSVTIGSGTSATGTNAACPINVYYESLHGQSVYTKAELNAAGATGPIQITQLGFNVTGLPTKVMPNFVIRMKHTTATNVASWIDNSSLVTVYSNASYQPTSTGWNMLTLSTPFTWNGTDNILVDTAFGLIGSWNESGTVQYTTVTNGYRYIRSDTVDQTSLFTEGYTATTRPNIKLTLAPLPTTPQISVSATSLSYGSVLLGSASTQTFTISNSGSGTLMGTITTPSGYSVALQGSKSSAGMRDNGSKNSLPYSVSAGLTATFDLTFTPTEAIAYNGNVSITHNAEGASRTIALTGNGITPTAVPFAEGFETGMGGWILVNGSQTNAWARGTATAQSGDYGLYVSNDGGTTNAYTLTSTSVAHAYCNVSFPSGTESWKLRFNWKGQGEGTTTLYDYLRVFLVEDTVTPVAETELATGQLGTSYNLVADWQEVTLDIPAGVNGQNRRLVFSWRNDSSVGIQPPAAIDDIRIVPGSQSDAAVVIDNTVTVEPPTVTDPESNVINTTVEITGVTETEGYALVITGYDSVSSPYENAGLDITFTGLDFAGCTITVNHDLGFIPLQIAYRVGDSGSWNIVNNPGGWTSSSTWFTLPSAKAEGDVFMAFPNSGENTLPVELSSFTATISANNYVMLTWVTQSEDNCLGYHIFRNETDALDSAIDLQVLVQATNTSQQQVYAFEDTEIPGDGTYYYWLQSLEMDGGVTYYGPISVLFDSGGGHGTPDIPLATELLNAYPNPFNPSTTIRYSVLLPGKMTMDIFNARGQKVRGFSTIHSQPGFYSIAWDGRDEQGRPAASGIYLYKMSIGNYQAVKRMVLSK
jgi:subtilisin family serine protease